jgi:predicted ester cyclase
MSAEENMALARRFMEARIKGDLEAVDQIMAPDFVSRTPLLSVQEPDREDAIRAIAQLSRAISNPSIHFEDQLAAADKVVSRFVVHATHDRGELMGVAPTGRELSWMAIFIHRISEGKIAEEWGGSLGLSELLRRQRLEQEITERERIEQEMRVARRIQQASLPEEVPTLEGWQISPYYQPAREVGGDFYDFHLLSRRWSSGTRGGGRYRQGRTSSAGHVNNLRHVAARRTSLGFLFAWGGTLSGQRDAVVSNPSQHVRHLLLRHP